MTTIAQVSRVIAQHWRTSLGVLALGLWQVSGYAQTQLAAPPATNNVSAAAAFEPPINPRTTALTGTLFNTREQRERLDRARQRGGVIEDNVETMVEAKPSVINGFVKRSDSRDTVWVDDVMKRDPRIEVMEQLEPNMVGGVAGGAIRVAASRSNSRPVVVSKIGSKRFYAKAKKRRKVKTLPKNIFRK